MTADDHPPLAAGPRLRLDEIVLAAAALDEPERAAYLSRLQASCPDLIERARQLLTAAAEVSESFLAHPAVEILVTVAPLAVDSPLAEPSPVVISAAERYEIGALLGAGGMGEVFAAHDRQLDRPVALKLLDAADAATRDQCLREARAQARVRHDNVLEVYDSGELDGRPFIALRRVDGKTLEEIRGDTSLEQQVALLIQVADGLHAAHLTGLVHRDVKPSNVLVEETASGELKAWVSDFGLAAAVAGGSADDEPLSGTTSYLAPERLDPANPPDRRGDVWSLGVTMYRLFTGVLPFDDELVLELLRKIRQQSPRRPRELLPALPPDLEAIVLKCLAKDPAERYPTAAELAADLRRFLAGEVVAAHVSGPAYRLTRFAIRHRGWVVFAAVAAGLLLVASMVAAVLGVQAMQANRRVALRQVQAEDLISFMLLDLRDKLDQLGRLELIDEVGSRAERYFAAIPQAELSDDELARHATALHQIGEVRLRQGETAKAVSAFDESLNLAQALAERAPQSTERWFELGQSNFWVGFAARELGDFDHAERSMKAYLELSERLVERQPEHPEWLLELSYALSNLGTLAQDRGDLVAARHRFQRSLEIKQALARAAPGDLGLRRELAWSYNSLGLAESASGLGASARRHFERELQLRESLVEADPRNVTWRDDLGVSNNYLGYWLLSHGFWSQATEHLRTAVELYESLVADDPQDVSRRQRLAINRTALGRNLVALGRFQQGLEQLESGRQILAELPATGAASVAGRRELAMSYQQLGLAFSQRGRGSESRRHLQAAVEILDALVAEVPEDNVARQRLAGCLILLGDLESASEQAEPHWRRAAWLLRPLAEGPRWRSVRMSWAQVQLRLGRAELAAPVIAELAAEGFCDPSYLDLCSAELASGK